ncbi:HD-GYP domain-containing protein [Paraglaciecola marina]|uniref:HD-GYP domain-containing protein n=1 Tax=Paraglaciecola marina TaxID=2500157 RepID=UPI001061F0A2|nr:HD-GYP domain-containing protein [Paraglaciecola marina]
MLKTILIDEVTEGMYIDSIVKQKSSLKIASRGRVTSKKAIDQLKKQGILAVAIDLSKQLNVKEKEQQHVTVNPKSEVPFESELAMAMKLHAQGKSIQKTMLNNVAKNLSVDLAVPQEFASSLVSSIDRNPNALMCMTKIREKDTYLLEHSLNVSILLAHFGTHIGLAEDQVQELALSGFLHDIGKIKIPDAILHKPGRLTDSEMDIMRKHVVYGTKVLDEMGLPDSMVTTISEHHERLDGLGYPLGLQGEQITKFGRMIAIVDTYDAITADRCYKAGMPSKKALQILLKDSPNKFDLALVKQFVQCVGIYPVGSLVKLDNEKVAMVLKQHPEHAIKPVVKVFYSVRGSHYLEPKELNLAASNNTVKIVEAVIASDYKLDFNRYFNESIAL